MTQVPHEETVSSEIGTTGSHQSATPKGLISLGCHPPRDRPLHGEIWSSAVTVLPRPWLSSFPGKGVVTSIAGLPRRIAQSQALV